MIANRASLPLAAAALALIMGGAAAQQPHATQGEELPGPGDSEAVDAAEEAPARGSAEPEGGATVTTVTPAEGEVTVEGEADVDIVEVEPTEGDPLPGTLYRQSEHTVLASTLMDADVVNGNGDDIGDVADLLLYPSGRLHGILFEVGGFLEIGEKIIAVDFSRLEIIRDADDAFVVLLRATEDEVDAAPRFVTRAEAEEFAEERAEEIAEQRGEAAEEPLETRAERLEERADALQDRAEEVEEATEERVEERAEERIEEQVLDQ
jgi:sporulation protein YlmC with PRC-barrel domain